MPEIINDTQFVKTSSFRVVLPFYIYASLSLLVACILLVLSSGSFTRHYFQPKILAITHTMALGWGTMIILGAGHQLLPVFSDTKLFNNTLAYLSFIFAALGIPLLIYSFYTFNLNWLAQSGGIFINCSIVCYLVNIAVTLINSKEKNVQAVFLFTATLWLLLTTLVGILLLYNFSYHFLPSGSLRYLPLHAHMGIIGWFLLMVIGVGSRLIPMFLLSKYDNSKWLWIMYLLINGSLFLFILNDIYYQSYALFLLPIGVIIATILLFAYYCKNAYDLRIRRIIDGQMKISLLSVLIMVMPFILLIILFLKNPDTKETSTIVVLYGFTIFFGWITAMILGMTFKTLPFIIWNKVYPVAASFKKTPNPKELFSNSIFSIMSLFYIVGFIMFFIGILFSWMIDLKIASISLLMTAILYNWNVFKLIFHKAAIQ